MFDTVRDACGICAVFLDQEDAGDAARRVAAGLFALLHRGQEAAGIAVARGGKVTCRKGTGSLRQVFPHEVPDELHGRAALGHVLASRHAPAPVENAQPMLAHFRTGDLAIALNGGLTNQRALRQEIQRGGGMFQSQSDAETLLAWIGRSRHGDPRAENVLSKALPMVRGAYAVAVLTGDRLVGARDPLGIRPLGIGRLPGGWVLASESCAVEALGGVYERDLAPGELVWIDEDGFHSSLTGTDSVPENRPPEAATCLLEYVFFARPDSSLSGQNIHETRFLAGQRLAETHPADADYVFGVPNSGLAAAQGYACRAGLSYAQGLFRNRYIGRSYLSASGAAQEQDLALKFSALDHLVCDQRLVLVDDSIVRGMTLRRLVALLRQAGARQIHLRLAAPPIIATCPYGVDMPAHSDLLADGRDVRAMADWLACDSLAFLELADLRRVCGDSSEIRCAGCFLGSFPTERDAPGAEGG